MSAVRRVCVLGMFHDWGWEYRPGDWPGTSIDILVCKRCGHVPSRPLGQP